MEVVRIDYAQLRYVQGSDPWDLFNVHDQIDLNGGREEYFCRIHRELQRLIRKAVHIARSKKIPLTSVCVDAPHRLGIDEMMWQGYTDPRHQWHGDRFTIQKLRQWFSELRGQVSLRVGNRQRFGRRFLAITFHTAHTSAHHHPVVTPHAVPTL